MTTFFYYSFTSLIFLILTFKLLILLARRFKNIPPGPPSLPLIGNLHQLTQPLHQTFHKLSQRYGQIFSLWFGSHFVVVVSSLPAAQECFTKYDIVLANRPRFLTGKYLGYDFTSLVSTSYGDHWRNVRRIVTLELLSTHRLNSFLDIRRDEIMRLIKKLAENSDKDFVKVELTTKFMEMTFNTIMRMISGKRYYGDECDVKDVEGARQFREMIRELLAVGGANNLDDFLAIVRWFHGVEKRLQRLSERTDAFLQGLIDEYRSGKGSGNTLIDHLLMMQQSQPEYYTDHIIKGLMVTTLIAGTDTSAVTLEWAMANLLNRPEVLKKARDELDTHIGQDRLVDEPDVSKLPYLQCIISETLRLHPAVPLLVPHVSSGDCNIQRFHIPMDTMVLVNAWAIHRDPQLWTEPMTFRPERFRKEGEAHKLIPFGLGRRSCPGAGLAQRTVGLTLGLLIQIFDWKRVSEEAVDMAEGKGITTPKVIPLEALCKSRPVINMLHTQSY